MENLKKQKKINIVSFICQLVETILTLLVVIICLLIVTQRVTNNEKGLLGFRIFKIETGSMEPKYHINDVILVKEIDVNKIEVGDALVYKGNAGQMKGRIITHEVIEILDEGDKKAFYTKGISNDTRDPKVSESQVLGTVIGTLSILTIITNLLMNSYTLYFLIILPASVYLVFVLIHSSEKKERVIQNRIRENQARKEKEEKERLKKTARTTKMKNKKSKKTNDKK